MQFELAEIEKKAPETQAMLVSMTKERDGARSEIVSFKSQLVRNHNLWRYCPSMSTITKNIYIGNVVQEAYDKYLELKLKEFKHVTKVLTCSHRIPAEAKQTVIEAIRGDVLIGRNQAWRKERAALLECIKDKEETEATIEAEVGSFLSCLYIGRAERPKDLDSCANFGAGNDVSLPKKCKAMQAGV